MARPRPTPLDEGSIQNMEREEIRFKSSVPVLTETDERGRGEWGEQQHLEQMCGLEPATCKEMADIIQCFFLSTERLK